MSKISYDCLFKLLLIGSSSVGKTCLLIKYVEDAFTNTFISTIGIDFKIKTIDLNGKRIKLQIWDTAGQERFRTITVSYYRGAMGILLVYDITNRKSFEDISDWMKAIKGNATDSAVVIVVGSKCDMEEKRAVSTEEGEEVARAKEVMFIETSAKTGHNVEEAFKQLSLEILEKYPSASAPNRPRQIVTEPTNTNRSSQCC